MKYLAVLGRQPEISCAELMAQFGKVERYGAVAIFECDFVPEIDKLGGSLKIAEEIPGEVIEFLLNLPEGKITLGVSDYGARAKAREVGRTALKFKKSLARAGRSVRVLPNKSAAISTAAALHNGLGRKKNHVELIAAGGKWYRVIGVQNIEAYAARDQARPARDARVGMLPPKLAQILINLCGPLEADTVVLDPFCGTGVVLQEALLMGYRAYGTDVSERMIDYTKKNLEALSLTNFFVVQADATSAQWRQPIGAVACETYLGPPMSQPPAEIKLKEAKLECKTIILGFLKNLAGQIEAETPVTIAVPAWLRPNGNYSRLNILDEIENLGYNVEKYSSLGNDGLLYHREGQVVAREIIVLRKK